MVTANNFLKANKPVRRSINDSVLNGKKILGSEDSDNIQNSDYNFGGQRMAFTPSSIGSKRSSYRRNNKQYTSLNCAPRLNPNLMVKKEYALLQKVAYPTKWS